MVRLRRIDFNFCVPIVSKVPTIPKSVFGFN